jgi:hypothetical protein
MRSCAARGPKVQISKAWDKSIMMMIFESIHILFTQFSTFRNYLELNRNKKQLSKS